MSDTREIVAEFLNSMSEAELKDAMNAMKNHHNLKAREIIRNFIDEWEIEHPIDAVVSTACANVITIVGGALGQYFHQKEPENISPFDIATIVSTCFVKISQDLTRQAEAIRGVKEGVRKTKH